MNDVNPALKAYLQKTGLSYNEFVFQLGPNFGGNNYTFFGGNTTSYQPNWQESSIHTSNEDIINSSWGSNISSQSLINFSGVNNTNYSPQISRSGIIVGNNSSLHIDSDSGVFASRSATSKNSGLSLSGGTLKVTYTPTDDNKTDNSETKNSSGTVNVDGNTVTLNGYTATVNDKGEITYKDKDGKTVTAKTVIQKCGSELIDKANELANAKKKA